jgi:hypothetical protein
MTDEGELRNRRAYCTATPTVEENGEADYLLYSITHPQWLECMDTHHASRITHHASTKSQLQIAFSSAKLEETKGITISLIQLTKTPKQYSFYGYRMQHQDCAFRLCPEKIIGSCSEGATETFSSSSSVWTNAGTFPERN